MLFLNLDSASSVVRLTEHAYVCILSNSFSKMYCGHTEHTNILNDDGALSFSIEILREAGASIGPIRSKLTPPKTTFEQLKVQAEALLTQAVARERNA